MLKASLEPLGWPFNHFFTIMSRKVEISLVGYSGAFGW